MRIMVILLGAAGLVYFATGLTGKYSKKKRLLFALAAYVLLYLTTMLIVLLSSESP